MKPAIVGQSARSDDRHRRAPQPARVRLCRADLRSASSQQRPKTKADPPHPPAKVPAKPSTTRRVLADFFSILVTTTSPISAVLATCVPPQG